MLYSYSFQNRKRDLADILSTVVKDEPRFISNFKTVADATARKHEWLEDQLTGRAVTVSGAVVSLVCPASAADLAKLKVGTLAVKANDSALFRVTAVGDSNFTVELAAANGSSTTTPASGDVLNIVSTPMAEGSNPGDGDETGVTGSANYNCTQIFRKDIILTGSTLAINVFGNADNQLNRQTAFALAELARDLNRVALFGVRAEASASVRGTAGGLYQFGTGAGSLGIDADGARLESGIINDAAQKIMGAGGEPTQILCSPGQARVLSGEYKSQLQILRADDRRGAYVAMIVNEINGRGLTIMADPDVPDTDVWVLDPTGFGLANLRGRAIADEDATPGGFDGIKRMALGELTFEFKNAAQRLCRIHGLQSSADALSAMRAGTAADAGATESASGSSASL